MRWITHTAIGFTAYTLIYKLIPIDNFTALSFSFYGACLTTVASVLPDRFDSLGLNKHRGFTHSLIASGIISLPFLILHLFRNYLLPLFINSEIVSFCKDATLPLFLAIFLGYTLHILADAFTDSGVELLYPKKKKVLFFKLWTYNTGVIYEMMLSFSLYIITGNQWIKLLSGKGHLLYQAIKSFL